MQYHNALEEPYAQQAPSGKDRRTASYRTPKKPYARPKQQKGYLRSAYEKISSAISYLWGGQSNEEQEEPELPQYYGANGYGYEPNERSPQPSNSTQIPQYNVQTTFTLPTSPMQTSSPRYVENLRDVRTPIAESYVQPASQRSNIKALVIDGGDEQVASPPPPAEEPRKPSPQKQASAPAPTSPLLDPLVQAVQHNKKMSKVEFDEYVKRLRNQLVGEDEAPVVRPLPHHTQKTPTDIVRSFMRNRSPPNTQLPRPTLTATLTGGEPTLDGSAFKSQKGANGSYAYSPSARESRMIASPSDEISVVSRTSTTVSHKKRGHDVVPSMPQYDSNFVQPPLKRREWGLGSREEVDELAYAATSETARKILSTLHTLSSPVSDARKSRPVSKGSVYLLPSSRAPLRSTSTKPPIYSSLKATPSPLPRYNREQRDSRMEDEPPAESIAVSPIAPLTRRDDLKPRPKTALSITPAREPQQIPLMITDLDEESPPSSASGKRPSSASTGSYPSYPSYPAQRTSSSFAEEDQELPSTKRSERKPRSHRPDYMKKHAPAEEEEKPIEIPELSNVPPPKTTITPSFNFAEPKLAAEPTEIRPLFASTPAKETKKPEPTKPAVQINFALPAETKVIEDTEDTEFKRPAKDTKAETSKEPAGSMFAKFESKETEKTEKAEETTEKPATGSLFGGFTGFSMPSTSQTSLPPLPSFPAFSGSAPSFAGGFLPSVPADSTTPEKDKKKKNKKNKKKRGTDSSQDEESATTGLFTIDSSAKAPLFSTPSWLPSSEATDIPKLPALPSNLFGKTEEEPKKELPTLSLFGEKKETTPAEKEEPAKPLFNFGVVPASHAAFVTPLTTEKEAEKKEEKPEKKEEKLEEPAKKDEEPKKKEETKEPSLGFTLPAFSMTVPSTPFGSFTAPASASESAPATGTTTAPLFMFGSSSSSASATSSISLSSSTSTAPTASGASTSLFVFGSSTPSSETTTPSTPAPTTTTPTSTTTPSLPLFTAPTSASSSALFTPTLSSSTSTTPAITPSLTAPAATPAVTAPTPAPAVTSFAAPTPAHTDDSMSDAAMDSGPAASAQPAASAPSFTTPSFGSTGSSLTSSSTGFSFQAPSSSGGFQFAAPSASTGGMFMFSNPGSSTSAPAAASTSAGGTSSGFTMVFGGPSTSSPTASSGAAVSAPFGSTPSFGGSTTTPTFGSGSTPSFGSGSLPAFGTGATTSFGSGSVPSFSNPSSTPSFSNPSSAPAFGSGLAPSFGGGSTPAFGSAAAPSFGSGPPSFGSGSTPSFGSGSTPAFGSGSTPSFGSGSTPSFGGGSTPTFSNPTPSFGSGATTTAFGSAATPSFGATPTVTPSFGAPAAGAPFGATTFSSFGAASAPSTTAGFSFGSGLGAASTPSFTGSLTDSTSEAGFSIGSSDDKGRRTVRARRRGKP